MTTNGCFDLIHPGHIRNLDWAKSQGDILIVGINSDASVKKLKGPKRPVMSEHDRAEVIAALKPVDYVFVFHDETPIPWLQVLNPHIHIKGAGSGSSPVFLPEEEVVVAGGGRVLLAPHFEGRSTTTIIEKILSVYDNFSSSESV